MAGMDGYADAHLHLMDMEDDTGYECIKSASLLLSCTSSHIQWDPQEELARSDKRIFPFYGTHPWFCTELPNRHIDHLSEFLDRNRRSGIGEIGLEGKRVCDPSQFKVFSEQLSLAKDMDRVAVIHMTGTEEQVLKEIKANKGVRTILHSFAGSGNYLEPFEKAGCYFSLSPRMMMRSEKRFQALLMAVPKKKLLIESDAPSGLGRIHMEDFVARAAKMMGMDMEGFVGLTRDNTARAIL